MAGKHTEGSMDRPRPTKGKSGGLKRAVGFSSTFGILGYFLIPGLVPATAAIVTGMVAGALIAKATSRK